jgi:D-alanyl-D-alanine carboxypeptidase
MRRDRLDSPLLSHGRLRRRTWPPALLLVPIAIAATAFFALGIDSTEDATREPEASVIGASEAAGASQAQSREARARRRARRNSLLPAAATLPVERSFKRAPQAGILFDVETGRVLWERHPRRELPVASLTTMMTALVIAESHESSERVRISKRSVRTTGSKVGLLPQGKEVKLGPLLNGLLLVSGNDTAVALAEHDAGSVERFVRRMNAKAAEMGLDCTRFSSPHGLADQGNRSCPRDLAAMGRAILADRRLAKVVGTENASFDFPIKGGRLDLYNNNPLMQMGRPGITGVKTGYTDAAGRCYVTTAKRGGHHLGVVLLHSPDPITQIDKLLDEGLKAVKRKD